MAMPANEHGLNLGRLTAAISSIFSPRNRSEPDHFFRNPCPSSHFAHRFGHSEKA